MEVRINKEIRDYTESMFFGLSMRQLFFSVAAIGIAVLLYFMCPTGFALPMQLTPLCSNESDEQFMSAFLSLFMIVTLVVYVLIAVVLV